jgi:hypothetical protein
MFLFHVAKPVSSSSSEDNFLQNGSRPITDRGDAGLNKGRQHLRSTQKYQLVTGLLGAASASQRNRCFDRKHKLQTEKLSMATEQYVGFYEAPSNAIINRLIKF